MLNESVLVLSKFKNWIDQFKSSAIIFHLAHAGRGDDLNLIQNCVMYEVHDVWGLSNNNLKLYTIMEWQTADSNLFKKQSGKKQWQTADSKLFKNQSGKHAGCVKGPALLRYSNSLFNRGVPHFGLMEMLRLCCIKRRHQGNWDWPWWWLCWCYLSLLV